MTLNEPVKFVSNCCVLLRECRLLPKCVVSVSVSRWVCPSIVPIYCLLAGGGLVVDVVIDLDCWTVVDLTFSL